MSVVAIIAAAGQGTRLGTGGPKALVGLAGEPLLVHAARAIRGSGAVDSIVVTAPSAHVRLFDGILTAAGIQAVVVAGGITRQASVAAGLNAAGTADHVLIHDAARPLVPSQIVRRVVSALRRGHPAVVPALPVTDTIKRITASDAQAAVAAAQAAEGLGEPASLRDGPSDFRVERVETTLNRSALRAMQTPQGFALEAIRRAHSAFADRAASELNAAPDDAALAEAAGIPVVLVRGSERAMKITRPFDLRIAELLLADPALC